MHTEYKVGDLIYDANIYDGMNTNLDDLQFYTQWMPTNKEALILELCCGTGRLTIPLAKKGHNITGVDLTPSMLKQANLKASQENVNIEFHQGDMRTLNLNKKYDVVFIPFNSIHHLYTNEDLFNALQVVKKHLKKDGVFLFDCFNPDLKYMVEAQKSEQEVSRYTTDDGREVVIKQTMHYDSTTQINRIKWHYSINGRFNSTQDLDMRLFYPQELDAYLKWMGFEIIHKFGSFEEEDFNDISNKQIFVCK